MPHVENSGDIGRRNEYGIGSFFGVNFPSKDFVLGPQLVPPLLYFFWGIGNIAHMIEKTSNKKPTKEKQICASDGMEKFRSVKNA
jgi:hypothetical protein